MKESISKQLVIAFTVGFTALFSIYNLQAQTHKHPAPFDKAEIVSCMVTPPPFATSTELPDGTTLQHQMRGDAFISTLETIDGYTILKNSEDGYFYYVKKKRDGGIEKEQMRAHNPKNRSDQEIKYLIKKENYTKMTNGNVPNRTIDLTNLSSGIYYISTRNNVTKFSKL